MLIQVSGPEKVISWYRPRILLSNSEVSPSKKSYTDMYNNLPEEYMLYHTAEARLFNG